jgi:hypothetical protein
MEAHRRVETQADSTVNFIVPAYTRMFSEKSWTFPNPRHFDDYFVNITGNGWS